MKELSIIGNIGKDATLNVVNSQTFINFSVAINESYNNNEGQKVEKTTWVECTKVVAQGGSTKIVDYLKKGTTVFVRGDVNINIYQTRENKTAATLKLRAEKIKLLGGKPETNISDNNQSQQPAATPELVDSEPNDLPF